MAQNTNRAWSDSASDSGYIPRGFQQSFDISLPTDPLPEFRSAFEARDIQIEQSQSLHSGTGRIRPESSRSYAAIAGRDYSSRDELRVTQNPYGTLPRQKNSMGYREGIPSGLGASQGDQPRLRAEAFQPMGSHSFTGQRRSSRSMSSVRDGRSGEFEAPRNYRNSSDFAGENPRSMRGQSQDELQGEHVASRSKSAKAVSAKEQKREERRRRRRHEQADKKFNRQFAGESAGASEAGPRAAVIKGEMGSKQRRAMRAQQAGLPHVSLLSTTMVGTVIAGIGAVLVTLAEGFFRWKTLKRTICVAAIIAIICACVYTPAQQYYKTLRLNDQLEAEWKAIEERNDALALDLATLGTREGIEARAHEQFGLVEEGEESANVLGLDYTYDHSTTMMAAIPSGSIETPDPEWYTPLLDAIFGVEKTS